MTRLLDTAFSLLGLAALWPLLLIVAIAVRLDSPGPALFRQRRVGRHGREFTIYKFRSMSVAEKGERGLGITVSGDRRITRLGRVLRQYKIDELPQLWNVLIGDMSLVGPRPESAEYVAQYKGDQLRVLRYRPGITSASSLEFLNEEDILARSPDPHRTYLEEILPRKLNLDLVKTCGVGVFGYLRLLCVTLLAILGNRVSQANDSGNGNWRVTEEKSLRGYAVESCGPEGVFLSKRNRLYLKEPCDTEPVLIAKFPAPYWKQVVSRFRWIQRLMRFSYYNVVPLANGGAFVTFDRQIGILTDRGIRPIKGLVRPTRVLRDGCALTPDGKIYFGEYLANTRRGPVHVYELDTESERLRVVHTFPPGLVRHVHGVIYDPASKDLICTTGDLPSECRILLTGDRFKTHKLLGSGDETWRAVSVLPTEDAWWYATDSQFAPNKLYRILKSGLRRQEMGDLPGPVYGSAKAANELFFAVTAELCPSQSDRLASLWRVDETLQPELVGAFEKDALPNRFFQHGMINFCRGDSDDRLLFTGVALRGADNRVFEARRCA